MEEIKDDPEVSCLNKQMGGDSVPDPSQGQR